MASPPALVVLYGFSVLLLCCPQLLGVAPMAAHASPPWGLEHLAATAFLPAILLTLVLTPLLLYAHVRSLAGRANAGAEGCLVAGLAKATILAATVTLTCAVLLLGSEGIVVQIGADGHLDRGRGDVARLNIK